MVETYILTRSSQFSNEHLVVDRTFPTRSSSWVLSSSSSSSPGLAILMGVCHEIFDPHFSIIPTTYFRIRFELPLFIIQIYSPMMDVFSHNRFLPVSSFKSDQRHAKFSILTPRCGFWLRSVDFDSAVWILTPQCGFWLWTTAMGSPTTPRNSLKIHISLRDQNQILKYFNLFVRLRQMGSNHEK